MKSKRFSMLGGVRKGLESSESSGLSSISSESEDDFVSSIDSSSKWGSSSEDEADEKRQKDNSKKIFSPKAKYDSDAESIEYVEARTALDLLELEDFNFIRSVDRFIVVFLIDVRVM